MSVNVIAHWASTHADKLALMHNGRPISYAVFYHALLNVRRTLAGIGLEQDSIVAVIIRDIYDAWLVVLALQSLGMRTVCLRSSELFDVLALDDIACLVTTDSEYAQQQMAADPAITCTVLALAGSDLAPTQTVADATVFEPPTTGGHILYTSGTTGVYKKLFFSAAELQAQNSHNNQYSPQTCFHLSNYGLWTGAGYQLAPRVWQAGGQIIVDQRDNWATHFLTSGLTHAVLTPSMVQQLLADIAAHPHRLSPRNFEVSVTSGFINWAVAEKIMQQISPKLTNTYATTEINGAVLLSAVTKADDLYWLNVPDGRVIEIVNERGGLCPLGEEGQLRVLRNAMDCSAYFRNSEATEKVFADGYYYPGDMAVRRADGRIRVLGRSVDVINFKGQKHAVAPIEQNIQDILKVSTACLFSGLNDSGEYEVVIAIEAEQWPEPDRLNSLGEEFSEMFDQVRFAVVFPFPRTQSGTNKVNRIALRELLFPKG